MRTVSVVFLIFNVWIFGLQGQNAPVETAVEEIHVLGHAHMDPVYRWRWNEIRDRELKSTFTGVLETLEQYPDLHFVQSSLLFYETVQQHIPKLFDSIKRSIANDRWSVVGGQWVEPDETLSSGESLIRQFLIPRDYYSNNLNINDIDIAWSADVFTGHPGTLPKIYAGCGIKTYVFSRAEPEGKKVFWWESQDGSRILAYKIPGHYNPTFRKLPEYIDTWVKTTDYAIPMITIGRGDHGGGPGPADINALERLAEAHDLKFVHSSPGRYFGDLYQSGKQWPVQQGEFGYVPEKSSWKGCYTSQARIKKYNRYFENQLLAAEKFSTIGTFYKGKPFYPREDLSEAWKILLFNQFHDIIPGTLTGLGVNDAYRHYQELEAITSELLINGLENIGNRIDTRIEGIPLVIYNPHSWPVSQSVEAAISFVKQVPAFDILDADGSSVPYDLIEKSADGFQCLVSLHASDIPPLGYEMLEVVAGAKYEPETDLRTGEQQVENSHYLIRWDDTGISSIFSKTLNREMLDGQGNILQILEDHGSSWSLELTGQAFVPQSLAKPEIIYSSPLKTVVRWEDYYQSSRFVRQMTVKAGCDQIDFEMEVDWHEHDKLLRVVFPTSVEQGEAYYDQPYGYVNRSGPALELPAQKWIDHSNQQMGVSLLNDGKYGFTIQDGVMTMSVVRGARDMDPRMDEGKHSFKYAIIAHPSGWREADIPLIAWQFNQPLIARQENRHRGSISGWRFSDLDLPAEKSFFSIESDHVIITSLKVRQDSYNPYDVVLRILETEGRNAEVTVRLPHEPRDVVECDHLERSIKAKSAVAVDGNSFTFKIGHDQIRTFMVRF
jgi:alpha-mannosidase